MSPRMWDFPSECVCLSRLVVEKGSVTNIDYLDFKIPKLEKINYAHA